MTMTRKPKRTPRPKVREFILVDGEPFEVRTDADPMRIQRWLDKHRDERVLAVTALPNCAVVTRFVVLVYTTQDVGYPPLWATDVYVGPQVNDVPPDDLPRGLGDALCEYVCRLASYHSREEAATGHEPVVHGLGDTADWEALIERIRAMKPRPWEVFRDMPKYREHLKWLDEHPEDDY